MKSLNRQGRRTLLFAAVLAVGTVCWLGCVDDGGNDNPANNNGNNSGNSNTGGNNTVVNGTFIDSRDSTKYKTVKIGSQTWMAENLNYDTADGTLSWCYENSVDSCDKYGRLYNWYAASTVCPSGWHLPTRGEWGSLAKAAGGTGDYGQSGPAGTNLKSKSGWNDYYGISGNGTDSLGFSALPGGRRNQNFVDFDGAGNISYWWTATKDNMYFAYNRGIDYIYNFVYANLSLDENGHSVRCVEDD